MNYLNQQDFPQHAQKALCDTAAGRDAITVSTPSGTCVMISSSEYERLNSVGTGSFMEMGMYGRVDHDLEPLFRDEIDY